MSAVISDELQDFINNLEQGDIIMHHAHGFLSESIRALDGSNYNHCSIYDKDGYVYESVTGGIKKKELKESIATQKTAAITNFRLENLPEDKSLLIETIEKYHTSNIYAYDQIVLLAMILLKKELALDNPETRSFVENFLIYTTNFLTNLFDPNNKNEICSEVIYRAYEEVANHTGNTDFHMVIDIDESMIPYDEDKKILVKKIKSILKNNKSLHFDTKALKKLKRKKTGVSRQEIEESFKRMLPILEKRKLAKKGGVRKGNKLLLPRGIYSREFVRDEIKNWDKNIKYFERTNPETAKLLKKINIHNFITPANISVHCLNAKKLNTFKTGIEYDSNCPFCAI